ncbi:heterogeneous ribonuclear particle protein, partial [Aphelenchoides avenae]
GLHWGFTLYVSQNRSTCSVSFSYKTALEQTSKVKKELLDDTNADSIQGNWAAREDALRTELQSQHRVDLAQKDAEVVWLQADLQAKGQRIAELTMEKAGLVKEKTRLASNFEKARQDARVCRQQVTMMEQKLAAQSTTSPIPPAPSAGISSRVHPESQIHVSHLSPETTEATLAQFFSSFGTVVATVVVRDSATKQSRGFGFVQFSSPAEVVLSVASHSYVIDGRIVHVNRRKR